MANNNYVTILSLLGLSLSSSAFSSGNIRLPMSYPIPKDTLGVSVAGGELIALKAPIPYCPPNARCAPITRAEVDVLVSCIEPLGPVSVSRHFDSVNKKHVVDVAALVFDTKDSVRTDCVQAGRHRVKFPVAVGKLDKEDVQINFVSQMAEVVSKQGQSPVGDEQEELEIFRPISMVKVPKDAQSLQLVGGQLVEVKTEIPMCPPNAMCGPVSTALIDILVGCVEPLGPVFYSTHYDEDSRKLVVDVTAYAYNTEMSVNTRCAKAGSHRVKVQLPFGFFSKDSVEVRFNREMINSQSPLAVE